MSVDQKTFSDWLWDEMAARKWNQVDLADHASLTKQAVNNYLNAGRIPTKEAMAKLASALHLPIETLYRAAGILPQPAEWNSDRSEWEGSYDMLTPEDRTELLEIARLKIARKKKNHLKVDTGPLKPRPSGA